MAFLTEKQLNELGLKSFGKNVYISDKASIYSPHNIEIGNNVRIDDFCILSPNNRLVIKNNIHISCYASIIGAGEVILEDHTGLSGRVSIYSSNDDYLGDYFTNPMSPSEFTNVTCGTVWLKRHVIVGSSSTILPNVILEQGVAVAANSVVTKSFGEFQIIGGTPAKFLKNRRRGLLNFE